MDALTYRDDVERAEPGHLSLLWFVVLLTASGVVLHAVAGPPHLPPHWPSWETILITLQGSDVPLGALAYIFTSTAWLLWLWIVGSLILRLIAQVVETLTCGATWARALHTLSDRVTLPIVRKVADGAVVAFIVVNLAARAPRASAAPLNPPSAIVAVVSPTNPHAPASAPPTRSKVDSRETEYTVQPGDTLWTISERFYGTGEEFPRLVDANAGRRMSDGRTFTRQGVIQPGWRLRIPLPSTALAKVDGKTVYVVEPGDTLRGIAARFLGDENRWPEIFDLNRGKARLSDGRALTNPDLIWPGLRLTLPVAEAPGPAAPAPAAKVAPPAQPVPPTAPTPCVPTLTPPAAVPVTPTTVAPSPTMPTTVAPRPTVVSAPPPSPSSAPLAPLAAGAVGLTLVGGAALLARRRVRRSLREPPVPAPVDHSNAEFAEAGFARALRHQLQDGQVEPVTLLTRQVLDLLATNGIDDASVVMARQERNAVTLTLTASLASLGQIITLAEELGTRLGAVGRAELTADHDVALRLSGLALACLGAPPNALPVTPLCLLPIGILPHKETLWANWPLLGHVLIAGLPGGGTDVILTSLLAALSAHRRPEDLRVWTVVRRTTLPEQIHRFPHQDTVLIDPDDDTVRARFEDLRAELLRRMRAGEKGKPTEADRESEIVLVLDELGTLPPDDTTLELIGTHGPAHGIRLIATTTNAATLGDLLAHFSTRLVLLTLDDDESILMLGQPEGADLGSGDVFVRPAGRAPVRVRGFQVSGDHLDELAQLMEAAYGGTAPETGRSAPAVTAMDPDDRRSEDVEDAAASPVTNPNGGPDIGTTALADDSRRETTEGARPCDETPAADRMAPTVDLLLSDQSPPGADTMILNHLAEAQASNGHDSARGVVKIDLASPTDPPAATNGSADHPNDHETGAPVLAEKLHPVVAEPSRSDQTAELVQVCCFGEFSVRSGGREITPSLAERLSLKAWELLAFLAAQPDGVVSREKLLVALWPDIHPDQATNRLNIAVSRLRAILAHQVPGLTGDVVRADRTGVRALDSTVVGSDVHRFVALCRSASALPSGQAQAALIEARTLYRGDIFAGRGSQLFEWVDERDESGLSLREQYREEYRQATLRLAHLYCRDGQVGRAVPLYKSLLKAEPTLEDVVRELFRCYQQLGDLGALLREERHFREVLREAYAEPDNPRDDPEEFPPDQETIALFETIRAELEAKAASRNGNRSDGSGT